MKKFIITFTSIITMMLFMAQPIFIKPIKAYAGVQSEVGVPNETSDNRYITLENILSYYGSDKMYYFVTGQDSYCYTDCLIFDDYDSIDENYVSGNYTYKYRIVNPKLNGGNAIIYSRRVDTSNQYDWKIRCTETEQTGSVFIGANYYSIAGTGITHSFGSVGLVSHEENFEPPTPSLNLEVSFSPSMSGSVTRQGTANGSSVTYNYLDLNIQNNGDNAQWLFAIVPHGQSLTFPESILNSPQGFIGSPSYVYIADEWIDWTNGLTGMTGNFGGIDMQMLYSPCAWHTLITQSDRTYHINWDMMKLSKNVSYDCVVYGMINEEPVNASSSGSGLGCWTVKSALSDIQEVYRSTFTMSNPPEFNPNSIDEGNSSHPWDPDIDNSGLFNSNNVYKDSNGNFVIKGGSNNSNGSGGSFYVNSSSVNNINNIFRNFFRFISGVLMCFPSVYQNIIALGLSALIVVGVVKVAIR